MSQSGKYSARGLTSCWLSRRCLVPSMTYTQYSPPLLKTSPTTSPENTAPGSVSLTFTRAHGSPLRSLRIRVWPDRSAASRYTFSTVSSCADAAMHPSATINIISIFLITLSDNVSFYPPKLRIPARSAKQIPSTPLFPGKFPPQINTPQIPCISFCGKNPFPQ